MNSPPEPASPSFSTPSSGSSTPDEQENSVFLFSHSSHHAGHTLHGASTALSGFASGGPGSGHGGTSSSGGGGGSGPGVSGTTKRRLPGGAAFGAASSSRDVKTRRREEPRKGPGSNAHAAGPGGSQWDGGKEGGKKDELLDTHVVEFLRKTIGDPFQEVSFE